jgi:hypothetical protein
LDPKELQKIYYSKILAREVEEHLENKSKVQSKFWRQNSQEAKSVGVDPALLKQLEETRKPAPMVHERGFLAKFSNNENLQAHKQRVVQE